MIFSYNKFNYSFGAEKIGEDIQYKMLSILSEFGRK